MIRDLANDVLDRIAVDRIVQASSVEEAWLGLLDAVDGLGFDYLVYATNRTQRNDPFVRREENFFLSTLPKEFMRVFWEEELYRDTFIARWAMQENGVQSLLAGAERYHSGIAPPEEAKAHARLVGLGVTSGYVIGLNPPSAIAASGIGFVNFGKDHIEAEALWDKNGAVLTSISHIFHVKISGMPLPARGNRLTKRQLEVLRWVARGKTASEVAEILNLSQATIEKHLRQSRDSLGVSTTVQAVLYAQVYSHIFTDMGPDSAG